VLLFILHDVQEGDGSRQQRNWPLQHTGGERGAGKQQGRGLGPEVEDNGDLVAAHQGSQGKHIGGDGTLEDEIALILAQMGKAV